MRLSVIQLSPGSDTAENIHAAGHFVAACHAADRPDLLVLPEMWTCLGGGRAKKFASAEILPRCNSSDPPGPIYTFLRDTAAKFRVFLHGGSIGEKLADNTDHIANTTLVFGPDGQELARYRKIHLFDITTPDGQGYRESSTYHAGETPATCSLGNITAGLAICYDLRFVELFLALRRAGAELILLPAAFTAQTGRDHWEPLLRARAIETQSWLAAAATTGPYIEETPRGPETRYTYGHSLICDPWGHVVARASDGPGWATARLDPALTARVRNNMPIEAHRRPGLFTGS